MASTKSTADALYEKGQVSPSVSVDDSPIFFREHGVFYGTSPAIGRLVDGVKPGVDGLDDFKADLLKDARISRVLEPFIRQRPVLQYALGADPGHYFASTIDDGQDQRAVLYLWNAGSHIEFFDRAHTWSKGVRAANGMMEIPYVFLRKHYGKEIKVQMEEGGYLLVHPRFAFAVISGSSTAYVLRT